VNYSTGQVSLVIITYRDIFQWAAKQKGEADDSYKKRSAQVQLSESDLKTLGIDDGAMIRLNNAAGSVVVNARLSSDCPQGIGYMPASCYSNELTSYDPSIAQLPNFKRIQVVAEPADE